MTGNVPSGEICLSRISAYRRARASVTARYFAIGCPFAAATRKTCSSIGWMS